MYITHHAITGLLPRLKEEGVETLPRFIPFPKPSTLWTKKDALHGQNDYIDLLGDGTIHPIDTHYTTPYWMKGFSGNEMQMLVRKRIVYRHWKYTRPQKWEHLNKRIDYLYKTLNFRSPPPPPDYPIEDY